MNKQQAMQKRAELVKKAHDNIDFEVLMEQGLSEEDYALYLSCVEITNK